MCIGMFIKSTKKLDVYWYVHAIYLISWMCIGKFMQST